MSAFWIGFITGGLVCASLGFLLGAMMRIGKQADLDDERALPVASEGTVLPFRIPTDRVVMIESARP